MSHIPCPLGSYRVITGDEARVMGQPVVVSVAGVFLPRPVISGHIACATINR